MDLFMHFSALVRRYEKFGQPLTSRLPGRQIAHCLRLLRQNIDFRQNVAQGADQRVSKLMIVVYEMVKLLARWTYR
jgi:hypothetical protein